MSASNFTVTQHTVPGQHIRHYARGTATSQEAVLRLSVNQYTPKDTGQGQPGDVTILACHASGFPKELYEPVWDAMLEHTRRSSAFRIRNIWIADVSNQNASGILNEDLTGNEPSYFDHARDLLAIVNHFRADMPRPIVGFGHSMGGVVMVNLALLHPRLLTTLISIEPVINKDAAGMNFVGTYGITFKKDKWPSRQAAKEFFRKNPFYKHWNPKTLDLFLQHGLRELPPPSQPAQGAEGVAVTLTTTKDQEVLSFARAAYPKFGEPKSSFTPSPRKHADLGTGDERNMVNIFYRPEAPMTFAALPRLRPSCFYIYGSKSHMAAANEQGRRDKREVTGTGRDGSGGVAQGRVQESVLKGSHFVPFESPCGVAEQSVQWLAAEMEQWQADEEAERKELESIPLNRRARLEDDWYKWVKSEFGNSAPKPKDKAAKSKL